MSDNIKVVVKVRPLISRELDQKLPYSWRVQNNTLYQLDHHSRDFGTSFTFDKVYDKDTKTLEVYNDVAKPIVEAAIAGFNGTIFAYGQTSSGKTYTMSGTDESPGIIPLAVLNLYDLIKKIPDRDFLVRVSYIEIYNETLKDLLNVENKNVKIRDTLQGVVKVDATEKVTCTPHEVLEIMKMGEANRQTGATNMNEESSRSHSIFQITIESREHMEDENEAGCVNVSTLNLVDLAGSERSGQTGATGVRFKEGTHINKSLSVLALVIRQLSEDPNKYANYRDSKLTRILQNSLGGNAKTSIICAITPASIEETISTLQFANRAKAIKNKPEVNAVATDATMIQSLTKQLSRLQSELASKKNIEQDNVNLQNKIEKLHKMILNGLGQRSAITNSKLKFQQLRRKTISTLHPVDEEPDPIVPKFCTPSLKYNPMSFNTDFQPIQSANKLTSVAEEARLITPPPPDRKVTFQNEIIELDSDDESKPDVPVCSPTHSCYESSKTPPCVLRKNAKLAEKNLKDLEELTERERIYTPQVVELIEKLEHKASIISKLEDEVDMLSKENKEKDTQLQTLKEKVNAAEQEVNSMASTQSKLEAQCKECHLKLIDLEVSYDTLKKKSKTRESELLSLLDEKSGAKKAGGDIGAVISNIDAKPVSNTLETPTDLSALTALLKDCGALQTIDDDPSLQIHALVKNSQAELVAKSQAIDELESNIETQEQTIKSLECSRQELQSMIDSFKDKLENVEGENELLKSKVESLNATVDNQKQLLETANGDMKKYNSLISELEKKLSKKEIPDIKINDSMLESLIANEEKFIANNENMKNIVHSFKVVLDMKTKQINEFKKNLEDNSAASNNNKILREQLDDKEQQINTLVEQVEKMRDQMNENVETINKFMESEQDNINKINCIEKQNESLHSLNEQYAQQIKKLQTHNEQLVSSLSEKELHSQNALVQIEDMEGQIKDLSHKLAVYEKEIVAQKDLINSFNNKETTLKHSCTEATSYISKVKEITLILNGNEFEIPETIDNYEQYFNVLGNSLTNLEIACHMISKDKQQLHLSIKRLEDELTAIQTHKSTLSDEYSEVVQQNEKLSEQVLQLSEQVTQLSEQGTQFSEQVTQLSQQVLQLSDEATVISSKLEVKTRQMAEVEAKLNRAGENDRHLQNEILSKDKTISGLQEKVASLNLEIQNLLLNTEKEIMYRKEAEDLINTLKAKEESYTELLKSKETEMTETLTNSSKERNKLLTATKELNDALEKRNYLLGIIMDKASKIKDHYGIDDSVTNGPEHSDNYEQILYTLDKIAFRLELISSMNAENKGAKDLLLEAQTQISELSRQNLQLMNECSEIERKNQELLNELNIVNMINTDLSESGALLDHLKVELKSKSEELDTMESKIRVINSKLVDQECLMKAESRELEKDKQRVKDLQLLDSESKCPKSLKTITLNKVLQFLLTNEVKSTSVSLSNSTSNMENSLVNPKTVCECISLSLQLKDAKKTISALNKNLKQLEGTNVYLLQEQEAVRQELQLLLEPSIELQKKITNHRTNLSTLTATTYAENKLLHSQLRVLKHHHNRYVHVCQRDLPGFRTQLNELMAVLKNSTLSDKHNSSFKRYSLPDVLDNNTSLKNESTFDGDLLMLDTNVTMTTTGDTTVVGSDQTCLDVTQSNIDSEETCTNDVSKVLDPRLVYSQIVDIANDKRIYEKIDQLEHENQKLRESLANCNVSPVKLKLDQSCNVSSACENCKYLENLKTDAEKFQEHIKTISEELFLIKIQKEDIENKYNNLMLEVPSTEALVKKLDSLEKEHCAKLNEITKLTSELDKKNKTIKELQYENDSLSTDIMDKVSEVDDLTKELSLLKDTLSNLNQEIESAKPAVSGNESQDCRRCINILDALNEKNKKLSLELEKSMNEYEKIKQAMNSMKCPQCAAKDELLMSLQKTSDSHAKMNTSLGDSYTTSRFNKICTLQNELHASKEDCKTITEEVTTVKNRLERSNISLGQSMDLDDSMGDGNIFNFTKAFDSVEQQMTNYCLPHIAEKNPIDIYTIDKTECFNYFVEKTGADKENLNYDIKIVDVMKMLYNNILTKHSNEVENLVNKLKDFEESKTLLCTQIENVTTENSKITKELEEKDNHIKIIVDVLSQIKENINSTSQLVSTPIEENNTDIIEMFREHVLEVMDSQFGLSSAKVFESLISRAFNKNQSELNQIIDKYAQLQGEMESILEEFSAVSSNLNELKSQLSSKEDEYNLLKAQKEKVHEICNAVTLDIIKKDQDLSSTVADVCKKLYDMNLLKQNDVDVSLSLSKTISALFERLMEQIDCKDAFVQEKQNLMQDIKQSESLLKDKERELESLRADIVEKENKLQAQKALNEDLNRVFESKLEENKANFELIEKLSEEINVLKTIIISKDNEITALQKTQSSLDESKAKDIEQTIQLLNQENDELKTSMHDLETRLNSQKQAELHDLLQKLEELTKEKDALAAFKDIIIKEKEACMTELDKCNDIIKLNKIEMEKMTSDIVALKEAVNDNVSVIEGLKSEAKSLLQQNAQLKEELNTKSQECTRLEQNIKTHEKSAEIQSKMIIRLQKQKKEDDDVKEQELQQMTQKYDALQKEHEAIQVTLKTSQDEIEQLKNLKESLEARITELEAEVDGGRGRLSLEAIAENSRRRRRSLHDSRRLFDDPCQDQSKLEAVFESRGKPDDLFMDVDDDSSNRSSPNRHSRGRDSLLARSDHTDDDPPSRPSSVQATRRRRQSIHDMHRSRLAHESPLQKPTENLGSDSSRQDESEVSHLRQQLASCQQELEDLKESYRELDEECETCAQYLRKREEQCARLKRDAAALENEIKELKASKNQSGSQPSYANVSVNTDEDWANLHSVVVDRMSFDAEVEKNKRLTKTIEELRGQKQDLKTVVGKLQRALEKHSASKDNRELEITKSELAACKQELAEAKERCRELDEECDTCAEYLRERDQQCRRLREAKAALEAKLQQYQDEAGGGGPGPARRKRQSLHDQNRASAATDTGDDLLCYQVERDTSQSLTHGTQAQEIQYLHAALERVRQEKAALEQLAAAQAQAVPLVHPTMYVAAGSGIVQSQQLTDVMKENQKLKKINAKLVNICKKRGKSAHESNVENEDPEQG